MSYKYYDCTSLNSVVIGSGVEYIGDWAFEFCRSLISVKVERKNPPTIRYNPFDYSTQRSATLYVPVGSKTAYSEAEYWKNFEKIKECFPEAEVDGIYYSFDIVNMVAEVLPNPDGSKYSGEIIIPSSVIYDNETYCVTGIGDKAFYNCNGMTSITIPDSIASIGENAFYGCKGLIDITIPESVTNISDYAFFGCSGLTAVTIPKNVTSIGLGLFSRCSNLIPIIVEEGNPKYDSRDNCNAVIETATNTLVLGCKTTEIPESVTSIGNDAFHCCEGLTSVTLPENLTSIGSYGFSYCSFTSITIPDKVKTIGNFAFFNCEKLTSVTLGNSVTNIGNGAFEGCSGMTSVIIPNSVTNIGNFAFEDCTSLSSIVIGSGVEYIGDMAFFACYSLEKIYCYAEETPDVSDETFWGITMGNVKLIVPKQSVEKYKVHPVWGQFLIDTATAIELPVNNTEVREPIYNLSGQRVHAPQNGLNIIGGKKVLLR